MNQVKQLVTIEERKWIAKHAVKEIGTTVKYLVMDVDKVVDKMMKDRENETMTPWIEIQPISEDMHKMPNKMPTYQKDPITGVHYGLLIDEDGFGNPRWQKPQLHDHVSLNLDKRDDAKVWAVLRFYPQIQGSPWQDDNPYYKIYDPVEDARVERSEIDAMKLAFDRVDLILDDPKAMVNFCRYAGEELAENSNYEIVRGKLLGRAKNYPFDFNRKWESKARSFGEFFQSARALGIIVNEPDRGYLFKGISLGLSSEEAIKFLGQDNAVMTGISNELADKDTVVKSVSKTMEKRTSADNKVETDFE